MPSSTPAQKEHAKADAGSPKSAGAHMAKRRAQGATYREIGAEHGVGKSTAHRNVMRQGFIKMGKAS